MRAILTTTLLFAAALCAGGRASGQGFPPVPYQQPPVSPYLNLLRRGSDPAINYYGLVRPIVDQQTFNQQFYDQQQLQGALIQGLEQQAQPGESSGVLRFPTTGHPTQVLAHMRYFQSRGSAAGASATGQGLITPTFANRPAGPAAPRGGLTPPPPGRGTPTSR